MGVDRQGERLQQLFELACMARGWTRSQLAEALGRDPSRLGPSSGNPKLDIVVSLARVLEWPVGDVVEAIYCGSAEDHELLPVHRVGNDIESRMAGLDPEGLYQLLNELRSETNYHGALKVARQMRRLTEEPEFLGIAFSAEAACWISLGRYMQALESANQGLATPGVPWWARQSLKVNLAISLCHLDRLALALGVCNTVLDEISREPLDERLALYRTISLTLLRGQIHRRLVSIEADDVPHHLEAAKRDLVAAVTLLDQHCPDYSGEPFPARRIEAYHALLQVLALAGERSADSVAAEYMNFLEAYADLTDVDAETVEAIGWTCLYGCELSLSASKGAEQQRTFAVFSNKAVEAADRIGHWSLRERILAMQYAVHCQDGGDEFPLAVDDADRAMIVSAMSRFPQFRVTGWRLLDPGRARKDWEA